jgi:hypothetical protein
VTVNAPERGPGLRQTRSRRSAVVRFEDVKGLKRLPTDGADFRFHDPHPELHDGAEGRVQVVPLERRADSKDGVRCLPYPVGLREDRTRPYPGNGLLGGRSRAILVLQQSR